MVTFDDVEKARRRFEELVRQHWFQHALFSRQWWLMVVLIIVSWIVWWKLVDKKRLVEISLFGALIADISVLLDIIGTNLFLWGYPIHLFWFWGPSWIYLDLSVMPVKHMLIYQYFYSWKRYIIALMVLAAISSFVLEPLFVWAGMYKLYGWKSVYSFPVYILRAAFVKLAVQKMMECQKFSHR